MPMQAHVTRMIGRRRLLSGMGGLALGLAALPVIAKASAWRPVLRHHGALVQASYSEAISQAVALRRAVTTFIGAPDEAALAAARAAWLQAREWYGQTEAFRFYGGPIDGPGGLEGRINAWPIDEAYLDYVESNDRAGIINDVRLPLTKAGLAALNERHSEANISTGWHAIEFLLWGQDLDAGGPGRRPASDYVDGQRPNAARRRACLWQAADLLVDDLQRVAREWLPARNNFRSRFERQPTSLASIFIGIGAFTQAEMAGERLQVALDTRDQEDEHSCFSDNTHRDFVAGIRGVRNVWRGEFVDARGRQLVGPAPRDLVQEASPQAALAVDRALAGAAAAADAVVPPFDQEVAGPDGTPGRDRVRGLMLALQAQGSALAEAAAALGLRGLYAAGR